MSRIVIGYLKSILLSILIIATYSSTTFSQRKETITINGYECVKGEVIVKFKTYKNNSLIQQSMKGKENLLTRLNAKIAKKWKIGAELWRLTPDETEKAIDDLKQNPLVEYVEPNYIITADVIPNDPSFVNLWGLNNTGQTGGTSDADINAPEAWDITTGDTTIIVGVIDSGIDYTHPDLSANMWRNPQEIPDNGIDDDDNGYIDDYYGYDFVNKDSNPMDDHFHGTHVAGTIGAVANNKVGIAGVAWNVKIIALKYLDASGRGNTADALSAIEYAVKMGVRITNNSWGSTSYSQALYDAIAAAGNAGVLFVAAAGNDAVDNDLAPHYPASYDLPNIISVAATNHDDDLSSFSNWGFNSVDLAAPGSNIFSTLPGGGYGEKSGTSMAAPHVSGALVLIWSAFPAFTPTEVKRQLIASVDRIAALSEKSASSGRLNAYNAVAGDNIPP